MSQKFTLPPLRLAGFVHGYPEGVAPFTCHRDIRCGLEAEARLPQFVRRGVRMEEALDRTGASLVVHTPGGLPVRSLRAGREAAAPGRARFALLLPAGTVVAGGAILVRSRYSTLSVQPNRGDMLLLSWTHLVQRGCLGPAASICGS